MHSNPSTNLWVGCVQLVHTQWLTSAQTGQLSHYSFGIQQPVGINTLFSSDFSQVVHTFCAQVCATISSVNMQLSTLYTGLTTGTKKYKKGKR